MVVLPLSTQHFIMLQRNLADMLSGVSFVFDLRETDDSDVQIKSN